MDEVKALGEAVQEVELSVQASDVDRKSYEQFFSNKNASKEETTNELNTSEIVSVGANRTLMI